MQDTMALIVKGALATFFLQEVTSITLPLQTLLQLLNLHPRLPR